MIPINNSDLAWLVVSDYNQDNNIGFPDALREEVSLHKDEENCWSDEGVIGSLVGAANYAFVGNEHVNNKFANGGSVVGTGVMYVGYQNFVGSHGGNIGQMVGGHYCLLSNVWNEIN